MSRILLYLIFSGLCSVLSAQRADVWKKYTAGASEASEEYLVQLPRDTKRHDIIQMGLNVLRDLGDGHWVVTVVDRSASAFREGIKHAPASPLWKLGQSVEGSDASQVRNFWVKWRGNPPADWKVVDTERGIYSVRTTLEELQTRWLSHPSLRFVELAPAPPQTEARVIDMNLNPNRVNKVWHFYPDLNAEGDTVSVQENLLNSSDIDLRTRVLPSTVASSTLDPHATEMATIIAGAGNSFVTGKGVAQRALIVSSDFINALPDSDETYQDQNVHTQNHSYGTQPENFYGIQAQAFDQSAYNNPSLLHVFSSGNQGMVTTTTGPYANVTGLANLTGNFKMAKNILVVGSVDTTYKNVEFVSRGPAYDGRVKPEVVAYSMFGSSNSAATVSGITLLMQQAYKENHAGQMPSALTKAILVNDARDVGIAGLDFITGYGSVDAYRSVETILDNRFLVDEITQGEVNEHPIFLPLNARNLKVTLSWTDLPAELESATALVNDLDLRLDDGTATTLPWVLKTTPISADLLDEAERGVDRLNNVEQVTLAEPTETMYTVEVEGYDVTGTQSYAIAWSFEQADTFEWDYPTGSDNFPFNGETVGYVRWSTTYTGTGTLSYSTDNGANWTVLDDAVDVSTGYWRWKNLPDGFHIAQVRMEIGAEVFDSEAFTISRPVRAAVGFHCGDSLLLQWPAVPGADGYDIFQMEEDLLGLYASVADTFLLVPNTAALAGTQLALQPRLGGKPLLRAATFDFTQQGVDCFLISFFQQVVLEDGIYLDLRLGTTYGVEQVEFSREREGEWEQLATVDAPAQPLVQALDNQPNQGPNRHQVRVHLANGQTITAESSVAYFLTQRPLLVFPNPVSANDALTITTKVFDSQERWFRLYDTSGSLIREERLLGTFLTVDLQGIRSGLYIYELQSGSASYTGRVVVR